MNNKKKCSIEDCIRPYHARQLCKNHYTIALRSGNLLSKTGAAKICNIDNCKARHYAKGYCQKHYERFLEHGDPLFSSRAENGKGYINNNGYRTYTISGKIILEHRLVMEKHIGRQLFAYENVHHKNGDRLDNRIENLEIWSESQPSGQRIQDKVLWAKQLLATYEPSSLAIKNN